MKPPPFAVPALLDAETRAHGLRLPAGAVGLVLIVHPDGASRAQPGYDFVADVLRANGFGTLSLCLHTHEDAASRVAPPGMVQSKLRIRALLDWVALQPALGQRPIALIGLGDAAPACVAAAARHGAAGLRTLVLLDGRIDRVLHHLERLSLPTLFVLGRCDARWLARHRAATYAMPAGHRLEMLGLATLPRPAPGALEAFACSALEWLAQCVSQGRAPGGGAGTPDARPADGRAVGVVLRRPRAGNSHAAP